MRPTNRSLGAPRSPRSRDPGSSSSLTDAPIPASGVPDGYTADDYVVHEQDVQAVMNALWAGGAEAIAVMDQRIIATSAVRCVGNTLLLHGRVYAPPYTVTAVGPPSVCSVPSTRPRASALYRQYVDLHRARVRRRRAATSVTVPAYDGPLDAALRAGGRT